MEDGTARLVTGIDTLRLVWKRGPYPWREILDRESVLAPFLGVENVPVRRIRGGRMVRCPVTGLRFGYTDPPGEHASPFLWAEHRAAAMASLNRRDRRLLPQADLARAETGAREVLAHYGVQIAPTAYCQAVRFDLTADLHTSALSADLLAVALLAGLASLDVPRMKRKVIHARESSRVQSVSWFKQSALRKDGTIKRDTAGVAYRKDEELRERLGENTKRYPGAATRMEWRVRPEPKKRRSPAELAYADLRPFISSRFARYNLDDLRVAHPSDFLRALTVKVGTAQLRGKRKDGSPRMLTPRVAERMAGTVAVLLAGLEDVIWSAQTRRSRIAELRQVGLLPTSDGSRIAWEEAREEVAAHLGESPAVDVGEYLRLVLAAFNPPERPPDPPSEDEQPAPEEPSQLELPNMPPPVKPRVPSWFA